MSNLKKNIFGKINLRNIWIFITEKCNLNCDYCFFSDRKGDKTLKFNQILSLLKKLPQDKKYDFVISGGEPLLCWKFTKRLIDHIKNKYSSSEITLQTNMFFLSNDKIKFLREKDIIIEPGIDGDFLSNFRHRKGFTKRNFKGCMENLNLIVKNKLRMNPTMTVHPQEVKFMFENFKKLVSLGLNSIDVHPAFLADWEKEQSEEFIRQYKKIINYERNIGEYLVCKSYSYPLGLSIDLIVQPGGFILPNWTFLSFPYNIRRKFFIGKLLKNDMLIFKDNLLSYLRKLKNFFQTKRTYREFSNFNACLILEYIKNPLLEKKFLFYKRLCKKIQLIDGYFLKKEDLI
jgi:organic radical activating enzyme